MKNYTLYLFWAGLLICTFLTRFINLDWGSPYFFHPDERNIASSVSQLLFPSQLNPHFFAYGSLPIYSIFFSGLLLNFLTSCSLAWMTCLSTDSLSKITHVTFEQAILISRLFSATLSCLTVFLLYKIAQTLWQKHSARIIFFLSVFCTGFIQFSHFGTFEMWTICFSLLLCYVGILYQEKQTTTKVFFLGVITGILLSIKISNGVFLPLSFLLLILPDIKHFLKTKTMYRIKHGLLTSSFCLILTVLVYSLTNPFVFITPTEFINSITYEKNVAAGILPVFYTQEFFGTIPLLFQFIHIFPFLINPLLTLLLPVVFVALFLLRKKIRTTPLLIMLVFFLVSFIPQAILFTKWTRYTVTSLPFLLLLFPLLWEKLFAKNHFASRLLIILCCTTSFIFSVSYTIVAYVQSDTREAAAIAAQKILPADSAIVSEVYDLGIVPFNTYFPNITLINTYDLEHNPVLLQEAQTALTQANYVILPSQRVTKTRLKDPTRFPKSAALYTSFTSSYEKIYETPCDFLCSIVYLGDPKYRFEQTAHVFDRPIIEIYKKNE